MSLLDSYRDRARYDIKIVATSPSAKQYSRKGYSPAKAWFKRIMSTLLTLLILAGVTLVGAAPSMADSNDWGAMNPVRDATCVATGYFNTSAEPINFQTPDTYDKTKPLTSQDITAYEKYGMSGLTITAWQGPRNQEEMDNAGNQAGRQLVEMAGGPGKLAAWGDKDKSDNAGHASTHKAFYNTKDLCALAEEQFAIKFTNLILGGTNLVVYGTNWVYEMAFTGIQPFTAAMEPALERVIHTLEADLYLEFLAPVIMLGALYLAWKGLVKRSSTEAASSAVWMIGAIVAGSVLMANPAFIPSVATTTTGIVNSAIMSSVAKAAQDQNPADNLCAIPASSGIGAEATKAAVRQFQCENWKTFSYAGWSTAQFGNGPGAPDPNNQGWNSWNTDTHGIGPDLTPWTKTMLGNKVATNQTMALTQLDNKVAYEGSDADTQSKVLLQVAASQTYYENPSQANTIWMARESGQKVTVASVYFIGAVANAVIVIIPAATLIMLSFMILIGMMVLPVFALFGVHPGMGRRVALGWVEAMAGFMLKMCTMTVFLAVSNLILHIVMGQAAQLGWIGTAGMVVIVAIALIKFLKPMLEFAGNLNLGGVGFMKGAENMGEQMLHRSVGVGKKATGVALAGAATGAAMTAASGAAGAGARRNNKQVKADAAARVDAQDAAAGAGERPTDKNAPEMESPQSDVSGAGDRPANQSTFSSVADEAEPTPTGGAGDRPTAKETVQEAPVAQPETARRVSGAEVETAAIARDLRIREAMKNAPVVNTRKVMFKAAMEASRSRSVVGGFNTGTSVANRHTAEAQVAQQTRLQQEAFIARMAEQKQRAEAKAQRDKEAAEAKAKRDAAKKAKDDANTANTERIKKQAADAKARRDAADKPGNGKHRGLPPLN